MIGYVKGIIKKVNDQIAIVVDTNGVGWKIFVGTELYLENNPVELYIYTNVKENEISLWGFKNYESLDVFENLISVSGVGPKTAYNILDEKGFENVISSILQGEDSALKVSGVGEKTAKKIVLDLKSKFERKYTGFSFKDSQSNLLNQNSHILEGIEALKNLGYRSQEIDRLVRENDLSEIKTAEEFIKFALKKI